MDGSVCDSCHQPDEWCVCDDPVQGEALEDIILDVPEMELDFSDVERQFEEYTFSEDFDRELGELVPEDPDEVSLSDTDLASLKQLDDDYEKWINEGGSFDDEL